MTSGSKRLSSLRRVVANKYMFLAGKYSILPTPNSLAYWRRPRSSQSSLDHYDFFPSSDDTASLHVVWAVDFVTPSTLDHSLRRIRRTDWTRSSINRGSRTSWVPSTRRINAGAWTNIGGGTRLPSSSGRLIHFPDLPDFFSRVDFSSSTVTPSLTAIVACFVVTDSEVDTYHKIARDHLFPDAVPNKRGSISIYDPLALKKRNVSRFRQKLQVDASDFMSRRFGTFLASKAPNSLPLVELLEFGVTGSSPMRRFLLEHSDVIKSTEGLVDWGISYGSNDNPNVSSMFYDNSNLSSIDLSSYGGPDFHGLLSRIHREADATITMWGTLKLSSYYDDFLSEYRDRAFMPTSAFRTKSSFIKNDKAIELADMKVVTDELSEEDLSWLAASSISFQTSQRFGQADEPWNKRAKKAIRDRARQTRRHLKNVTEMRRSLNESYGAFTMSYLGRISLMTAVASLLVSAVALLLSLAFSSSLVRRVLSDFMSNL